jgi:hypothetical protein
MSFSKNNEVQFLGRNIHRPGEKNKQKIMLLVLFYTKNLKIPLEKFLATPLT